MTIPRSLCNFFVLFFHLTYPYFTLAIRNANACSKYNVCRSDSVAFLLSSRRAVCLTCEIKLLTYITYIVYWSTLVQSIHLNIGNDTIIILHETLESSMKNDSDGLIASETASMSEEHFDPLFKISYICGYV
jgi:hypothetical protein